MSSPDAITGIDLWIGRGQLRRSATIIFAGGRIADVVDGPAPAGLRVLDGSGLVALPGLVDAHVHWRRWAAALFLRFGVTTVRDVGSPTQAILAERAAQQRGDFVGPRIFAHGPLLDGSQPVFAGQPDFDLSLDTAKAAAVTADNLLAQGLDGLKTYANIPPELLSAVAGVANSAHMPVASHLGSTSALEAARAGVRSIEHASGVDPNLPVAQYRELLAEMTGRGTWVVATNVVLSNLAHLPTIGTADHPGLDLVPTDYRDAWLNWRSSSNVVQLASSYQRDFNSREDFIREFVALGGLIGVGTDTPSPFVVPGLSLHEELRQLVSLGMTPTSALDAATLGGAQLLGRRDLGTLQSGALADVVLVRADPRADIGAASRVAMVVQSGKVVYRSN